MMLLIKLNTNMVMKQKLPITGSDNHIVWKRRKSGRKKGDNMMSGKAKKMLCFVIVLVAVVLIVCFLPLPRHVRLSVNGLKTGDETNEVQVTFSLDIWQLNYLFGKDKVKGTILVSELSGREMLFETDCPIGLLEEEGLYWATVTYYNADKDAYEGAYLYWNAEFTDVRIEMGNP